MDAAWSAMVRVANNHADMSRYPTRRNGVRHDGDLLVPEDAFSGASLGDAFIAMRDAHDLATDRWNTAE